MRETEIRKCHNYLDLFLTSPFQDAFSSEPKGLDHLKLDSTNTYNEKLLFVGGDRSPVLIKIVLVNYNFYFANFIYMNSIKNSVLPFFYY